MGGGSRLGCYSAGGSLVEEAGAPTLNAADRVAEGRGFTTGTLARRKRAGGGRLLAIRSSSQLTVIAEYRVMALMEAELGRSVTACATGEPTALPHVGRVQLCESSHLGAVYVTCSTPMPSGGHTMRTGLTANTGSA